MQNNGMKPPERLFHDFMTERKCLMNVVGFGPSKNKLYTGYVVSICAYFYFHFSMNLYGTILALRERGLILHALHLVVLLVFNIWALTTRVLTDQALGRIRKCIQSGFYSYENEVLPDEHVKIREDVVQDIRNKSRDLMVVWFAAGLTICVLFPVIQKMTVSKEEYEAVVDIANPYLPAFFYMPFNTRTIWGFLAAYVLAFMIYFYSVGFGIILNDFYISSLLQLRAQLRILNYSIRNIHKRAIGMYSSIRKIPKKEISIELLYQDSDYQKCITKCLKSNIQHHQLLLRFYKEFVIFGGSLILLAFSIAAIALALNLYLIIQNESLNISIKSFMNLLAQQMYVLYLCVFGEIIMDESSSLFESLYSVPWFYYNKSFNQTLRVFMFSTMKPMRVKSLILDLTASLETYANFLSTTYKILNVLKQSDTF